MIYQKLINFTNQMKDISFIWWIDWAIWYIITVIRLILSITKTIRKIENCWSKDKIDPHGIAKKLWNEQVEILKSMIYLLIEKIS